MSRAYKAFAITGTVSEDFDNQPVIPSEFKVVWRWFLDLNSQRQELNSIAWTDTASYFQLRGERPSHYELELLTKLDDQYIGIMREKE